MMDLVRRLLGIDHMERLSPPRDEQPVRDAALHSVTQARELAKRLRDLSADDRRRLRMHEEARVYRRGEQHR
jgi:hypothetical protein